MEGLSAFLIKNLIWIIVALVAIIGTILREWSTHRLRINHYGELKVGIENLTTQTADLKGQVAAFDTRLDEFSFQCGKHKERLAKDMGSLTTDMKNAKASIGKIFDRIDKIRNNI